MPAAMQRALRKPIFDQKVPSQLIRLRLCLIVGLWVVLATVGALLYCLQYNLACMIKQWNLKEHSSAKVILNQQHFCPFVAFCLILTRQLSSESTTILSSKLWRS